jgi:hypothetical protein
MAEGNQTRTIILELDELDYDCIQDFMAKEQLCRDKDGIILPEGESNLAGAIMAEAVRNLEEWRQGAPKGIE